MEPLPGCALLSARCMLAHEGCCWCGACWVQLHVGALPRPAEREAAPSAHASAACGAMINSTATSAVFCPLQVSSEGHVMGRRVGSFGGITVVSCLGCLLSR